MEQLPKILIDWNDAWGPDLYDLGLPCSIECFQQHGISIQEGVKIRVVGDDLEADAVVVLHEYNNHRFFCAKIVEGTMLHVTFPESDSN
jgi:hypothetical protein